MCSAARSWARARSTARDFSASSTSLVARRARAYYQSADRLLPLIDADSRPALRVLVKIYSRLLAKIEERRFDTFTTRVQVPTWQKLAFLAAGMARMLVLRLRGAAR